MTDDKAPNFAQDALNFHWQECQRLTAERDAAYARGLAAGRAEALQEVMSDTETFDYRLGYAAGLEAAAGMCDARGEEWEAEADLKEELYACRDAIRALAQQPPPTGGKETG